MKPVQFGAHGESQLQRFLDAQAGQYDSVLRELRSGRKASHWMWYIFPQLAGLGSSAMAERYAIASLDEAAAYLAHPVLGQRLIDCTRIVVNVETESAEEIFPYPDDLKFRSSITLFSRVTGASDVFVKALGKYYRGRPDPLTLELLQRQAQP